VPNSCHEEPSVGQLHAVVVVSLDGKRFQVPRRTICRGQLRAALQTGSVLQVATSIKTEDVVVVALLPCFFVETDQHNDAVLRTLFRFEKRNSTPFGRAILQQ
jgi:hypothetical protein